MKLFYERGNLNSASDEFDLSMIYLSEVCLKLTANDRGLPQCWHFTSVSRLLNPGFFFMLNLQQSLNRITSAGLADLIYIRNGPPV